MENLPDIRALAKGHVLLVDKPYRWTSFDVVNKLRWLLRQQLPAPQSAPSDDPHEESQPLSSRLKIGHAGTLDPLATGLLIICTGKETKKIDLYQGQEKEYTGTFAVGATTPCYDLEQPVDKLYPADHITEEMIHAAAKKFTGDLMQVPPLFSAVKVSGKRAYDIARSGKTAEITPRPVTISEFEITRIVLPVGKSTTAEVDFRVVCSKGTYIRALARDLGVELKSGAHLTALCRTRIGTFRLEEAWPLKDLVERLGGTLTHDKNKIEPRG
jgi:tRNA pseudouridine55 synthase